jgi:hypothetical protein
VKDKGYFEIRWTIEDGYENVGREWSFSINHDELPQDFKELDEFFDAVVYDEFKDKVQSCGLNKDEFLAWAKRMRKAKRD